MAPRDQVGSLWFKLIEILESILLYIQLVLEFNLFLFMKKMVILQTTSILNASLSKNKSL